MSYFTATPLQSSMTDRRKFPPIFYSCAHVETFKKAKERPRWETGWCVVGIPAAGVRWEEVATIRLEVAPPRRQLARCRNTEHRQLDRIHLLDLPIVNATKEIPIRS